MPQPTVETVAVVGVGYVGLTTACGLANVGHRVIGYDINATRIDLLASGRCPIHETGLPDLLVDNLRAGRLRFTTDLDHAVDHSDIVFVCVPTLPGEGGQADISIVQSVVRSIVERIGRADRRRGAPPLIVLKSTVPPGTADDLAAEHAGAAVRIASNPEFLKEGAAVEDFLRPDRVVIGVADPQSRQRLERVFMPFVRNERPIVAVSRISAEMIKYAANVMLAGRISLINELANICRAIGVDVNEVRRGIGYDRRIGFEFLYPGLGFGGSCLPKDLAAMIHLAATAGCPAKLLQAIEQVNRDQRFMLVDWAVDLLGSNLAGSTLAVWGLSYKPGTDDIRQAPALDVIDRLLTAGANVNVHDPVANHAVQAVFADRVAYFDDAYAALAGAEALLICTEWGPFRRPDFDRMHQALRRPLVLDGRNLYEPAMMAELGFEYYSVGRPSVRPGEADSKEESVG